MTDSTAAALETSLASIPVADAAVRLALPNLATASTSLSPRLPHCHEPPWRKKAKKAKKAAEKAEEEARNEANRPQAEKREKKEKEVKKTVFRMCTAIEVLEVLKATSNCALYPEDNQWVACIDPRRDDVREYICVGDYFHRPGKSHQEEYGYPEWGDKPTMQFPKGMQLGNQHGDVASNTVVMWTDKTNEKTGKDYQLDVADNQDIDGVPVVADYKPKDNAIEMLRAETMHKMVETFEYDGAVKKMVFLTNKQAGLVAGNLRSIKLLFEFLETPEPRLVIDLLRSQGTVADTLGHCTDGLARLNDYLGDGRVRGVHPWASLEEATRAEQKLDAFMESVLIPIAEKNNAVVVCECLEGDCFLSASFNRVMAMQASRNAGAPLITVIAFSCDLESLYRNGDPNAKWRRMRSKSHHWRVREKGDHGLLKLIERKSQGHYKHYGSADLDMSAANFIIVDGIDVKTGKLASEGNVETGKWGRRQAFNLLKVEVVRYLTASASEGGKGLPSIALKTGYSARTSLEKAGESSSGLRNAVACLESGSGQSLIFIDLRERPIGTSSAEEKVSMELPEYVLKNYSKTCETLISNQDGVRCDYFDVMAAAYCWLALHNSSDSENTLKRPRFLPLCEALSLEKARAEGGRGQSGSRRYRKVVTQKEVHELAWLLANKLVEDAFEVYYRYEICDAKNDQSGARRETDRGAYHARVTWGLGEYLPGGNKDVHAKPCKGNTFPCSCIKKEMRKQYLAKHMETQVKATAASLGKILNHENFHGCSIVDIEKAKRLVETLVKQDRLPPFEGLEGLELLQRAWTEYDVAIYLAARYKRYSLFFYSFYLVLGLAVVVVTVIASEGTSQDFNSFDDSLNISRTLYSENESMKEWLSHVIFGLSLAASLVLSFQSYLNPTQRAEQLRSSAASLESITWLYRTKVGPFERGSNIFSKAPERALLQALKVWNSELVAGTDLEHTDLKKKFSAKTFKHFQYQCADSHPRRRKADLQHNKIEALELHLRLLAYYLEGPFEDENTDLRFIGKRRIFDLVIAAGKNLKYRANALFANSMVSNYDELLMKGTLYRSKKDWSNAAKVYEQAIALNKKVSKRVDEAVFRLGEVHMQLGEEEPQSSLNLGYIRHFEKAAYLFREVQRARDQEEEQQRGLISVAAHTQAHEKHTQAARKVVQDMKANEQIKLDSFDDHQSPVTWEAYLQLRVQPAIENYNQRIPRQLFQKNLWQSFLFICTASGAALSYSNLTPYVAMVSAAAAATSAWIAFGQRTARLVRYTRTVRQLEELLAWWSTQGDAEKSAKINKFVTTAELIITSERQAWQTLEQTATAEETNGDTSAEKKRGGKTRSETGRSETRPVDIETGQQ